VFPWWKRELINLRALEIIIAGIPNKKSGLLLSEKFSGL
jgi:hypothetical protein